MANEYKNDAERTFAKQIFDQSRLQPSGVSRNQEVKIAAHFFMGPLITPDGSTFLGIQFDEDPDAEFPSEIPWLLSLTDAVKFARDLINVVTKLNAMAPI